MKPTKGWHPKWALHPGESIREHLDMIGWTQARLARESGWTPKHINMVIKGHVPISAAFAVMLEDVLCGPSAQFWMNLETAYEIAIERGYPELKSA